MRLFRTTHNVMSTRQNESGVEQRSSAGLLILLFFLALSTSAAPRSYSQNLPENQREISSGTTFNPVAQVLSMVRAAGIDGTNDNWVGGFGSAGSDGQIVASVLIDNELYVAGDFSTLNGRRLTRIAMWDGLGWHPLGTIEENGINGGTIKTLAADENYVYVGGQFQIVSGQRIKNIARWNRKTNTWSDMGPGIGGVQGSRINSLVMHDGRLFAGGQFVVAGTTVAVNIAEWTGDHWIRVGSGMNAPVETLWADADGLYASGSFTIAGDKPISGLARYDYASSEWSDMGIQLLSPNRIVTMTSDNRYLYVGGRFTKLGSTNASNIARYDKQSGTWSPLKTGVSYTNTPNIAATTPIVTALSMRGTDLFAGGLFDFVGTDSAWHVARWSTGNETWSVLAGNSPYTNIKYFRAGVTKVTQGTTVREDVGGSVKTFAPLDDGSIYMGGDFDLVGYFHVTKPGIPNSGAIHFEQGTIQAGNLCRLTDGDRYWVPVGSSSVDATILALAETTNDIYAGGKFVLAGSTTVKYVARYSKESGRWFAMGEGVEASPVASTIVRSIEVDGSTVYVGGSFSRAGGLPVSNVARWNQQTSSWSALGTQTFPDTIIDMDFANGILAVVHDKGLAIWNGSTWDVVPDVPSGAKGTFNAVHVEGDSIFVGGSFTSIGSTQLASIASFNRTTRKWSPLREGINGKVEAMEAWGQSLYVGGDFTSAGTHTTNDLASWDMKSALWDNPGGGLKAIAAGDTSHIYALQKGPYGIYFTGNFTTSIQAGSASRALNIGLWDGKLYHGLGDGLFPLKNEAFGFALSADSSSLHVGGLFDYVGNKWARNFGEWTFPDSTSSSIRVDGGENIADAELSIDEIRHPYLRHVEAVDRLRSALRDNLFEKGAAVQGADHPDDIYWDERFSPTRTLPGANDEVFDAVADESGNVYIGGVFSKVQGLPVDGVAMWNGVEWEALSDGTSNGVDGFVFSLLLDGSKLYVGGQFNQAGGRNANGLAVWDIAERQWSTIGTGVTGDGTATPFISDMVMVGSDLYVAGNFTAIDGVSARSIAKWNGTTWSPLGSGVNGVVNAVFEDGGKIYVGGSFGTAGSITSNALAYWDGSAWQNMDGGVNGSVNDIVKFGDRLLIGGQFDRTACVDASCNGTARISNLLYWDQGTEKFYKVTDQSEKLDEIRSLYVDGNRIYTGGSFEFVPDITLSSQKTGPARIKNVGFNTQSTPLFTPWDDMSVGTDGPVNVVIKVGSSFYVGGSFNKAGSVTAANIVRWNSTTDFYIPLSTSSTRGAIAGMAAYNGQVFAAGPFTPIEDPRATITSSQIAYLGSGGWKIQPGTIDGAAYAIGSTPNDIVVGGTFITTDGKISVNVIEWQPESQTWHAIQPGSGVADQDDLNWVNVILTNDEYIYLGGLFGVVDTFETPHVARFNRSTQTWEALGEGLNGQVWALAFDENGRLYAGGDFTKSGTRPMVGVAMFDGTAWQPLGGGVNGKVRSIAAAEGKVYVGGDFTSTADGPAMNVAAFDYGDNRWHAMGDGLYSSFLPAVDALAWHRGRLYAGGFFQKSGSQDMYNISRWRDGQWQSLGSGVDHAVWDILPVDRDIYVSGVFRSTGGFESPYIGLWHDPTLSVDEGPRSTSIPLFDGIGPNPFVGGTRVRYTLPVAMNIRLEVLDMSGRSVAVLAEGKNEAGEHIVEWNPDRTIPAGVYYCRLSADGEIYTEKIVRY